MKKLKAFGLKYKYGWTTAYFLVYMVCFHLLETHVVSNFTVIHMRIDDYIPFCEYFIIPYLAWFPYVAAGVLYFLFTSKSDYQKLMTNLITGMTVFLLISAVFPNGHLLRPYYFTDHNIFTALVQNLYLADTQTNVFPSVHVFNAIAIHCAVSNSERLKSKKWLQIASLTLVVLIVLATLFLKQHSVSDDLASFLLAAITYRFVYEPERSIFGRRTEKPQIERA